MYWRFDRYLLRPTAAPSLGPKLFTQGKVAMSPSLPPPLHPSRQSEISHQSLPSVITNQEARSSTDLACHSLLSHHFQFKGRLTGLLTLRFCPLAGS
ncbi:MAG: hypothetical protein MJE68_26365 [Proteobacteria bacterium]|nr:hypothetical protein [Pseudomonadota bacterium]